MEKRFIRFDPIFETCRQNRLDLTEKEQYFNAMISEHEKQEIAEAYKEEGLREGYDKGVEKGKQDVAKAMKKLRYTDDDICKVTGLDKSVVEGL